jgi:hypothetical protein
MVIYASNGTNIPSETRAGFASSSHMHGRELPQAVPGPRLLHPALLAMEEVRRSDREDRSRRDEAESDATVRGTLVSQEADQARWVLGVHRQQDTRGLRSHPRRERKARRRASRRLRVVGRTDPRWTFYRPSLPQSPLFQSETPRTLSHPCEYPSRRECRDAQCRQDALHARARVHAREHHSDQTRSRRTLLPCLRACLGGPLFGEEARRSLVLPTLTGS